MVEAIEADRVGIRVLGISRRNDFAQISRRNDFAQVRVDGRCRLLPRENGVLAIDSKKED